MKSKIAICLSCAVSLFCIFSAWETYHGHPLKTIAQDAFEEESVKLSAKAYTPKESVAFLDRNINSRGYQPIQVTIQNNTAETFSISASGFNIPAHSAKEVSRKVLRSSIPRSVAFSAASFLFWPFMIPSAINSVVTYHSHALLQKDLTAKEVKDEVIAPFSTFYRVLFVKENEVPKQLELTLIDLNNLKPLECSVELSTT